MMTAVKAARMVAYMASLSWGSSSRMGGTQAMITTMDEMSSPMTDPRFLMVDPISSAFMPNAKALA